jgi:hypothetical protein
MGLGGAVVGVIEVNLGELGVRLPRDQVGIVIAQPHVSFVGDGPFAISPATVQQALDGIDETLNVARMCKHGSDKTHFTIFPECTLPGLRGIDLVTETITRDSWPTETIVIGGVDGLTRVQLQELLRRPNTIYDTAGNSIERIGADQWLNCCLTWVKLPTGVVQCYVQPKLAPAWIELDLNYDSMYQGRSIYLFKGVHADCAVPYRFATLLCFDWIGVSNGRRMWQWLLKGIDDVAAPIGAVMPLTWLFVAQCNPAPSHASFMSQVGQFFDSMQYPNVNRANTCLVMANVAGKPTPGRVEKYGRSAVIFTPDRFVRPGCMPTYGNGGESQRAGSPLENFIDAVFREGGSCIHSFTVLNPDVLPRGSAGKRVALLNPTVHPFAVTSDPRVPAASVSAVVKWVNDEIDDEANSLGKKYHAVPLAGPTGIAHKNSVDALRTLSANALSTTVVTACPGTNAANPDIWKDRESKAVAHVLDTFSILEVAQYRPTFHGQGAQATVKKADVSLEVVAVFGKSHEECDRHVMEKSLPHRGQLLLVSRDEDNTRWNSRLGTIFDQAADTSAERDFTDPRSAVIHIGYQQVLDAYLAAAEQSDLEGVIDAALS